MTDVYYRYKEWEEWDEIWDTIIHASILTLDEIETLDEIFSLAELAKEHGLRGE